MQAKESAVDSSSSGVCKATKRPRTASEGSEAETSEAPKPAKKKKKRDKVETSSLPEVRAGKRERSGEDEDCLAPRPKAKKRAQKDGVGQAASEVSKESRGTVAVGLHKCFSYFITAILRKSFSRLRTMLYGRGEGDGRWKR